ncbi:hypothetical protein Q9R08_07065 [Microbacterium sp. QXD-8]|uniref:PH domain-containing protein n=1 Tax=Microbacterium psychrotolerans TaxID=3068321 RepID=A0ABU0YZG4_9MICO|nr:hypothetical protein [Microbacterium sp. QXD-8]MDQ7877730.1 hypothetical protein [Microbacterium sp. QXD-8]
MAGRAKPSPLLAVEGGVPAPAPIYRSAPLLGALALFAGAVGWVGLVVLFGGEPWMFPVSAPEPWLFLALVPSVVAILLAVRGIALWSLALAVVSCWLVPTGIATMLVVLVALWAVRGIRSQWAAHDLDSVIATAAAHGLPVLVVQHVAGRAGARKTTDTTQVQVRDVDTGELTTARVWGPMRTGTTLVRQGMNVIAQAPPGAEAELRRWVERQNRRSDA